MGRDVIAWALALLGGLAAIVLIVNFTPFGHELQGWGSGLSPLQVIATIITPIGATTAVAGLIINGRAANRTLRQSVRAERANRFQQACMLLAASSLSARMGGLHLMHGVVGEDPKTYMTPVLQTVTGLMIELDGQFKGACGHFASPRLPYQGPFPPSDPLTPDTIYTVSAIRKLADGWQGFDLDLLHEGRLLVQEIYLRGFGFVKLDLDDVFFNRLSLGRVEFQATRFARTQWIAIVFDHLRFEDCDLTGATMALVDKDLAPLTPQSELVAFVDCKTEGLTVNGLDLPEWLAQPAPEARVS